MNSFVKLRLTFSLHVRNKPFDQEVLHKRSYIVLIFDTTQ